MFYDSATGDEYSSDFALHPIFDEHPRRERMVSSRPTRLAAAESDEAQYVVDMNFIILVLLIFFVTLLAASTYYSRIIRGLEKRIDAFIAGRRRVGSYDSDDE